ncbi:MAG TPA: ribbon-helix-helix domain-containing protein [Micavibrio sp.]
MTILRAGAQARNIVIDGRRTSMRMEAPFWRALEDIARYEKCSINEICTYISQQKEASLSLTSATRVYIALYYKQAVTPEARQKVHGNLQTQIRAERFKA